MARPSIQVILGEEAVPTALHAALRRTGAEVSFTRLADALTTTPDETADAFVVIAPRPTARTDERLRMLFQRLAERPRATLVVTDAEVPAPRLPHPPTLPVSLGNAADETELAIRLQTMLEMRPSLESLHRGMVAKTQQEEHATRRYINQLRLARQVQREFIPDTLPRFGPVHFAALFRPADFVSGDVYDVHRLDHEHVGIALADAAGHGIAAALLTVFIKRSLRGKELENGEFRILPPDEVLRRLNEEILEVSLSECRFIAAVYAVLNTRTLLLTFARGGAPYPIRRTRRGAVELLRTDGGVVGVLPEVRFERGSVQLARGDSVYLYSDGLEKVVISPDETRKVKIGRARSVGGFLSRTHWMRSVFRRTSGERPAPHSAKPAGVRINRRDAELRLPLRGDTLITESSWYATLRDEGNEAAMEQLMLRYETLRRMGYPLDDLTALVLHVDP